MSFYSELERFGNQVALIDHKNQKITYAELAKKADKVAKKLNGSRNLVFIFCSNSIASVVAYLACLRNGHVPLLVDQKINQELVEHLIEIYRPNYLIMPCLKSTKKPICEFDEYLSLIHISGPRRDMEWEKGRQLWRCFYF